MNDALTPADLLIPLDTAPQDARSADDALTRADAVVYRLGLQSMPVHNLPERLDIGGIRVDIVRGPVLAQRTTIRQRAGILPATFDKHMVRQGVGAGEQIAVFSINEPAVPKDVQAALLLWRQRAEAAAGLLSAVLDERVVGTELFEDAIVMQNGTTIGAIDVRERIRSFLPFEVTALDSHALRGLARVSVTDGSPVARAARLYRRAALEGPTADAYVMLFVAAEAVLERRQPRKVDLDTLLERAGVDPDGLPLHTGLLIDLRGKIVHEGLEDHERLRTAFYEMEAIVRVLIRNAAELVGGWFPTHDIASYAEPWPDRIGARDPAPRSIWHEDGLPHVSAPPPERVPRKVLAPQRELLVQVSDRLRAAAPDHADLLANIAVDTRMRFIPDDERELVLDVSDGSGFDIEPARMLIGGERLEDLADVARFVGLTVDFTGAAAYWVALQEIVGASDDDVTLRSAIASWYQYHRLVVEGELPPELLKLPGTAAPMDIGVLAGWAGAGHHGAADALGALAGRAGELARAIQESLIESPPTPPRPTLDW